MPALSTGVRNFPGERVFVLLMGRETNEEAPPDEDARLMLAFQQGDEGSFDRLFSRYKDSMVNFAFRYTGRRDVAEELAQDIFVKCYLAAPRYKPSAKFKTWLYRIARNHCLNEVRRQDYRYRVEPLQGVKEPDVALTPEQQARARALEAEVQRVMGDLPESQRTALLLSRFQAMSYADIAQTMETSVSAVKSLLNRAKGTLLRRLSGHLETCHEV